MRASWLIPRRFREVQDGGSSQAGFLNRLVTDGLELVARRACLHPIHTIVVIALLASTTYVGLLEGSLFDSVLNVSSPPGQVDNEFLLKGGRSLRLGQSTGWRWQVDDTAQVDVGEVGFNSLGLFCLIFDRWKICCLHIQNPYFIVCPAFSPNNFCFSRFLNALSKDGSARRACPASG